jgi:hypothetical protein
MLDIGELALDQEDSDALGDDALDREDDGELPLDPEDTDELGEEVEL